MSPTPQNDGAFARAGPWIARAAIVAAILAAYANSFSGAFVYDDEQAILGNSTIRRLWPIGRVLNPPRDGSPVTGRPLANLSFALNYAVNGIRPWGYHALNVGIHALAACLLFEIVRRTLERRACPLGTRRQRGPVALAFAVAVLWALHPLQTESVTYLSQRAESLAGVFYLLTLAAFIRGIREKASPLWLALSWLACLCGMATKEVMVSAPLVVLFYDRTLVSGTFRSALKLRGGYYLGLAVTWILLVFLVANSGSRNGTAGFGVSLSWWRYAAFQTHAIVHYLRLSFWPHPLIFLYSRSAALSLPGFVGSVGAIAILICAAAYGFAQRTAWGFAALAAFAILAPTSSILPISTELIAEHRFYLPLATVIAIAVNAADGFLGRSRWSAFAFLLVVLGFGGLTAARNRSYRSPLALWTDTVESQPVNPYAENNLGIALVGAGRPAEALAPFGRALEAKPDYAEAHLNLGLALVVLNRTQEAIGQFEEALRIDPTYLKARYDLGNAYLQAGRLPEAVSEYRWILERKPDYSEVLYNLGNALARSGRTDDAIASYRAALRIDPGYAEAHNNLGITLRRSGHTEEAIAEYRQAIRIRPDYADAHANLGVALANAGRLKEAADELETAVRLDPGSTAARQNLDKVRQKLMVLDQV